MIIVITNVVIALNVNDDDNSGYITSIKSKQNRQAHTCKLESLDVQNSCTEVCPMGAASITLRKSKPVSATRVFDPKNAQPVHSNRLNLTQFTFLVSKLTDPRDFSCQTLSDPFSLAMIPTFEEFKVR